MIGAFRGLEGDIGSVGAADEAETTDL